MSMNPTIYKTSGQKEEVKPENGKYFTLDELQQAVGGYIEFFYLDNLILVCNEEGLLIDLPFNQLVAKEFGHRLVGDILVTPKEFIR